MMERIEKNVFNAQLKMDALIALITFVKHAFPDIFWILMITDVINAKLT
jgi:hypothetical protein